MGKKDKGVKIMAFFALFGITIGIIGTGVLILFSGGNQSNTEQKITPEQYQEIQKMIKEQGGTGVIDNSGALNESGSVSLTGSLK